MLEYMSALPRFFPVRSFDSTNPVWRLHSRVTVYLLTFFTILLSARSYFGNSIDCLTTASGSVQSNLQNFCWTLGTFISRDPNFVDSSWDFTEIGTMMGNIPKEERFYQKYYQWVPFLLAFQVFLFSLPKHLWRIYEDGRLESLCQNLTSLLPPEAWTTKRKTETVDYLTKECRHRTRYALVFVGLETLNFVVVMLNMLLLNFLFGGFWTSYQPAVRALFSLDMNAWTSYNSLVFPKLAKCDFSYIGPSGSKQTMDALCLLPQNIVNEKIFAFIWLYLILLVIVSGANLCYRLVQLGCQNVRYQSLFNLLEPINHYQVKDLVRDASFGQWFLLYQMARNINKVVMREIVKELAYASQKRHLSRQSLHELDQVNSEVPKREPNRVEDDEIPL